MASLASNLPLAPATTIKLPNGRFVCKSHWLIICPECAVDLRSAKENDDINIDELEDGRAKFYDGDDKPPYPGAEFEEDEQDLEPVDEGEEDSRVVYVRAGPPFGKKLRLGYGKAVPGIYVPRGPNTSPAYLFPDRIIPGKSMHRFINRDDPTQFLIYTRGRWEPRTKVGCAFAFRSPTKTMGKSGYVSFPMEMEGPMGSRDATDVLRAELRAMLAALRFRDWSKDGFKTMVLATDNNTLGNAITTCVPGWKSRGWITKSKKKPVAHLDLWQCFLGEIERFHEAGLSVKIWHISPASNTTIREYASRATMSEQLQEFGDIVPEAVVRGW
ncbi:ribonuclease H-like domain-containing protein [Penicillium malachiteum]|uniref:ribonuclease H-like domain-containing protein n=1 Tax=Penicillium malachiteum TaxID=1324776 RepID=UPI0025482401|nr:ribonuclease H-like domain-containing protein [Penicillium malachiteum]KAJ5730611.1 ribonuclease H-like domain-containing protein [Penicillium malachiteum]